MEESVGQVVMFKVTRLGSLKTCDVKVLYFAGAALVMSRFGKAMDSCSSFVHFCVIFSMSATS